MIELVLVYCLSAHPTQCQERRIGLDPAMSALQCTLSAQTIAQDYLRGHPAYALQSWRCEVDKPRENPA